MRVTTNMDVTVLNLIMNDKQKIFVMVGVGSLAVFLITILATREFSFGHGLFISRSALDTDAILRGVRHTNWFGMIALFNIVVSLTGFFLFADKE